MNIPYPLKTGTPLYRAAEVRDLDRYAIEDRAIPGYTLMSRAGEAAFKVLREYWPGAQAIGVLCGTGNNGGDGFVLARLAKQAGMAVKVAQLGEPARLRGDAKIAAAAAREAGVHTEPFASVVLDDVDVVVDALLGTGLERPPEGEWAEAVNRINASSRAVLAVDIPTGLHADTGAVLGTAVRADRTVTFIGRKRGLYTGEGPACAGAVDFFDLDVPADLYNEVSTDACLLNKAWVANCLPSRARTQHKGANGHVLVIGGEQGMVGAARLAGEAAARTGAGLVSVATRPAQVAAITAGCPELMVHGIDAVRELWPLLERATVIAIGPGLGQSNWSHELLQTALASELPLVVDADGLNLLARQPQTRANWILTPHPGEAARLLGSSPGAIQADRFSAVTALARRYQAISVLKGAGTLIHDGGDTIALSPTGNPGMGSGGMGDVLTGVIASLVGQRLSLDEAAAAGVFIHGAAADAAAEEGERGILARDVIAELRTQVNLCP